MKKDSHGGNSTILLPVESVKEMLLGDVEVKVGASRGSEGVVAAALQAQEMAESLLRKHLGGVENCVLYQVGQT